MTSRTRLRIMLDFTADLANLSKCCKRSVAAILTDRDLSQVYSIGINGGPRKGSQCLCGTTGRYGCIHAEINCLIKCQHPTEGMTMIITLSPCVQCASAIINAGITRVIYLEEWKDLQGLALLRQAGVTVLSGLGV